MAHLEQLLNLLKVIFYDVESEPSDQDDAGCKNFLEALQTARSDDEALLQKLSTEVTYATMLDIGNLMLAGCDPTYFWQSFNPPTDTILPTQMLNQGSKLVARFSEVNNSRGRSMIILHTDQNLVLYTTNFSMDSANRYFESRTPRHCAKWLRNSPGKRYKRIRKCVTGEVETFSTPILRQNSVESGGSRFPDVIHLGGKWRQPDGMAAAADFRIKTTKIDPPNDFEALTKAFSGFGVDEDSMVSILGKWHSEHLESFRKRTPKFFLEDERLFERWDDHHIACLTKEFLRFKDIVVQWIMHPWERDARLVHEAISKGPQAYGLLIEIACTRSSEELLGARKAYQSLFDQSIEDVASRLEGIKRKLLVALVSSYRYEGLRVNEGIARLEAMTLAIVVKNVDKKNPIEDDGIVRILTTRSKFHLKAVVKYYKKIYGKNIDEDLDTLMSLKETLQCLCNPQSYFSKVLNNAFKDDADENTKEALTRVIMTWSNVDMKEIIEEFDKQYKVPLTQKIEDVALGNYKDFLVSLIRRVA
eukprot:XP_010646005.1 PREDICTED: annexin D4 [Vitis vinifera]